MKIANVMNKIDDRFILEADGPILKKKKIGLNRIIPICVAACLMIMISVGSIISISPASSAGPKEVTYTDFEATKGNEKDASNTKSAILKKADGETMLESYYDSRLIDGPFSSYIMGKVGESNNVGNKIGDGTATAFWRDADGKKTTYSMIGSNDEVTVKCEIFEMNGVSSETAILVRFLESTDAFTTEHYYVFLNPAADTNSLSQYVRIIENDSNLE